MSASDAPASRARAAVRRALPCLALGGAVGLVYLRVAAAPLMLDDLPSVIQNPSIRTLWPLSVPLDPPRYLPTAGRPLVNLSLAVNHALGGLSPAGYRLFSFALHACSAGLVYSILRRSLESLRFTAPPGLLAFLVAMLWAVHPLQTEAVAYVTQRSELLMGLFYLLTLYGSLRFWSAASRAGRAAWLAVAAIACLAGMACKETMVSAPIVVLLYERAFHAGSLRAAWRRSRPLHVALFLTWTLLAFLNHDGPRSDSAGFHLEVSPLAWWLTQTRVLWMYLKLVVWPWPLVIHYEFPYLETWAAAWPWATATLLLVAATALAWWRNRLSGLVWSCVLLLLAPTSLVPIVTEMAAERRMYLPLAAILAWGAVGAASSVRAATGAPFGAVAAAVVVLTLAAGIVSARRLDAYADPLTLWLDTVAHQPESSLAHNNLAMALDERGRIEEAIEHFERSIGIKPSEAATHFNLAGSLVRANEGERAIHHYLEAIRLRPDFPEAETNLGIALAAAGRLPEAVPHFRRALEIRPDFVDARLNLGMALAQAGRLDEAVVELERALALQADRRDAHDALREARRRLRERGAAD